jgi:hypothetical protein
MAVLRSFPKAQRLSSSIQQDTVFLRLGSNTEPQVPYSYILQMQHLSCFLCALCALIQVWLSFRRSISFGVGLN